MVEPTGARWNPLSVSLMELRNGILDSDFREDLLPKIQSVAEKIKKRKKFKNRLMTPLIKRRQGEIGFAVRHVLELASQPMHVKKIHEAVVQELGRPVPYSTVMDCFRDKRRRILSIKRVGYGWYQIRIEIE